VTNDEYQEALSEAEEDILPDLWDPIQDRFTYVCFVSRSKGRHRKRSKLVEVELISDRYESGNRWYTYNKFPWDTKSSEALSHTPGSSSWSCDNLEAEEELKRRITRRK